LIASTSSLLGKKIIVTATYNNGTLKGYLNGILKQEHTVSFAYSFTRWLAGYSAARSADVSISSILIRSQALTADQVAAEHALLREIYPEIPSVKIGEQEWATSNLEMVATPEGNVIKNITDNTEWSNAKTVYDSVYAATTGTVAEKEYAALKESAYWCYYNNDSEIGAVYGKLYNWYAAKLLDLDMASSNYGWRVPTQAQFNTLATTLGGISVAGGKMKVPGTDYWNSPNTGATNESGFSLLGYGNRNTDGIFGNIKNITRIWTTTESTSTESYASYNTLNTKNFNVFARNKLKGFEIRLIKE
jgi:uncharacterized protein (TIGR02145 family)